MNTIENHKGYITFREYDHGVRIFDVAKAHITSIKTIGSNLDTIHDEVAVCTNDTDTYPYKGAAITIMKPSEWALYINDQEDLAPFKTKDVLREKLLEFMEEVWG
jgi:hypothetical protein